MKTMKEVNHIICNVMTDEQFDRLQDAEWDRFSLDRKTARNGLRRLTYHLKKFGLTVAEWDAWDAE